MRGQRHLLRFAFAAVLLAAGCSNPHESIFATPPTTPTTATPSPFVNGVWLFPSGVMAGAPSRGTVTLSLPAPAGGAVVSLSATGAVSLPASVNIPAGATEAQFDITTATVGADTEAVITASGLGTSRSASLGLWTPKDTFLYWASEPDFRNSILGGAGLLVGPPSRFTGYCVDSGVRIQVDQGTRTSWDLSFGAPLPGPMRVGTFDAVANRTRPSEAGFSVFASGASCSSPSGRFVVREVQLATGGAIRRFSASFDMTCAGVGFGPTRRLVGEVRVSNLPTGGFFNICTTS